MANWHNKHVSTQWGIAVVGFLLIATALLIPYLNQQQNTQSNAMYMNEGGSGYRRPTPTRMQPTPTRRPFPTPTRRAYPTPTPRGYWW